MRVIRSEYIKNKIEMLEQNNLLAEFINLPYDEKIKDINKKINDNQQEIKCLRKNKESYISEKELKPEVKEIIDGLKRNNNILIEYSQIIKKNHILELENIRLTKINVETESMVLTANQNKLLNAILNNNSIGDNNEDLAIVCRYIIGNYKVTNCEKEVLVILKRLFENISFEHGMDDKLLVLLNSINVEISKKLLKLEKNDNERVILNNFKSLIKNVIMISKVETLDTYDYKLDIIKYWLTRAENIVFIEKLFERIPETVNIRTENNEHLINYILEKYIEICKLELRNQGEAKVSSSYLKSILRKVLNSDNLELLDIDELLYKNMINEYEEFLKTSDYKHDRIVDAINDLNSITSIEKKEKEEIDEHDVNEQLSYIKDIINMENNNKSRVDLTNEYTIAITNDNLQYHNYSYIIDRINANKYCIKVNLLDIHSLINEGSPLDLYLRNKMFSNINNKDYLFPNVDAFALDAGKKMPTLTFEMFVNKKGEVISFDCYKSVSSINKILYDKEILAGDNMPMYYQLLNMMKEKYNKDCSLNKLEELINESCIKSVAKYFDEKQFPCIYRVQEEQNSEIFGRNISALNGIFYRISKDDFRTIYSIICEDFNYAYYDVVNCGHKNKSSKYYLDLLNPLDSYIAICLQRLVHDYYLSNGGLFKFDSTLTYLKEMTEQANQAKSDRNNNKQKILL